MKSPLSTIPSSTPPSFILPTTTQTQNLHRNTHQTMKTFVETPGIQEAGYRLQNLTTGVSFQGGKRQLHSEPPPQ